MTPTCKRGHPRTPENIRWAHPADRKPYSICKVCQRLRQKLRYRNDTEFMMAERQRTRANYHRRQEQPACQP